MLVLSRSEVADLLDLDELIDALAVAMSDLSAGRASVPARMGAVVPDADGRLMAMVAFVPSQPALVAKVVSLFPLNAGTSLPTHQALIVAFDPQTGAPLAVLDGTEITAVRTGACSALSVRLLARKTSSVLAVLGTGVQARAHARAVPRVRDISTIRLAGRDRHRTETVAAELTQELGIEVRPVHSYEEAVRSADIVCATTHAVQPVVRRGWLAPGTHVTSVGYNVEGRELEDAVVADALLCVESRAAALAPAPAGTPDLREPLRRGVITEDDIHAELGELVDGTKPGRADDEQITLYKSVGVAVQDAVAATLVLRAAQASGAGRELEM